MFARTALRESEIVVRNALGASRLRVMGQLFAESLVLSMVSAAAGIALAQGFINYARANFASDVDWPGWQTALRSIGGGGTRMQIGPVWSVLIIFQVALSVLGLPIVLGLTGEQLAKLRMRGDFDSAPYLTFRPDLDPDEVHGDDPASAARMGTLIGELERRLEAEPEVAAGHVCRRPSGRGPGRRTGGRGPARDGAARHRRNEHRELRPEPGRRRPRARLRGRCRLLRGVPHTGHSRPLVPQRRRRLGTRRDHQRVARQEHRRQSARRPPVHVPRRP